MVPPAITNLFPDIFERIGLTIGRALWKVILALFWASVACGVALLFSRW